MRVGAILKRLGVKGHGDYKLWADEPPRCSFGKKFFKFNTFELF
jgi:hypothetical protein